MRRFFAISELIIGEALAPVAPDRAGSTALLLLAFGDSFRKDPRPRHVADSLDFSIRIWLMPHSRFWGVGGGGVPVCSGGGGGGGPNALV